MSRRSSTKAENETNQNNSTHIQAHYDKTPVIYIQNLNNKHEYTFSERIEPGTFSSFGSKSDNIISVYENGKRIFPLRSCLSIRLTHIHERPQHNTLS